MANKNLPIAITITLIWDAHALNRDEKVGGNILSIKKLSRNGKPYSFISKTAIRHYLWETLRRANGWEPAPVTPVQNVVQFDLSQIKNGNYPEEIDLFGYMGTAQGQRAVTRKSRIGITKAIAIEEYAGDMAFYANHDLATRANDDPNPYSKEEHSSFYLASFTLDVENIYKDENFENLDLGDEERKRRARAVLEALHNGLIAQSSGELNTLVPVFFIAAPVKVPVPIFHGRIKAFVNNDGKLQVTGIEDAIKGSEQWLEGGSENIYIYHTNNVSVKEKDIQFFSGQFGDWLEKVLNLSKENIIAIELTKLVKQYKNISFDDVIQILQSIKSILDLYKQNSGNPVDKDTILKQVISEQQLEQLAQDGWVVEKTENEGRKVYEPTAKLKEFLK